MTALTFSASRSSGESAVGEREAKVSFNLLAVDPMVGLPLSHAAFSLPRASFSIILIRYGVDQEGHQRLLPQVRRPSVHFLAFPQAHCDI